MVELYCKVTIRYNPNPGSSIPMPPHWVDQSQSRPPDAQDLNLYVSVDNAGGAAPDCRPSAAARL